MEVLDFYEYIALYTLVQEVKDTKASMDEKLSNPENGQKYTVFELNQIFNN